LLIVAGLTASCSLVSADKTVAPKMTDIVDSQSINEKATAIQAMYEMPCYMFTDNTRGLYIQ